MAPRQRLSPQPSLEEIQPNTHESSEAANNDNTTRPLIQQQQQQQTSTITNTNNDTRRKQIHKQMSADESDIARERHDLFNLVALLFVIAATAVDWDLPLLFQGYGAQTAFKGEYFWWTWGTSTAYFLTDLIWVSLVPHCVKSPGTIVKHHLVVVAYLFGPIAFPKYRWFMGACLSVEINTWFLILRRVVYKRKIALLYDAVSASFYLSWIVIRCFVYPAIMVTFVQLAIQRVGETNQLFHWPMIFMPVHFVLCLLNLKWSYDLFMPIIKTWLAKDGSQVAVSNGL